MKHPHQLDPRPFLVPPGKKARLKDYEPDYTAGFKDKAEAKAALLGKRFLARLDTPEKHWKFSAADLRERTFWDDYREAYEDMLNATSTEWSPWYVIPADKKWFTRACVADIITSWIRELNLKPPEVSEKDRAALAEAKQQLEEEDED